MPSNLHVFVVECRGIGSTIQYRHGNLETHLLPTLTHPGEPVPSPQCVESR